MLWHGNAWDWLRLSGSEVEQPAKKRSGLVAADAYHCRHSGGMCKKENNPAHFEKDPKKGLNWPGKLPV